MKKIVTLACAGLIVMSAFISRDHFISGIQGTIEPPNGAKKVWAISGKDSLSTIPVMGKFSIDVRPGTWKLSVEGAAPYRNMVVENILVEESRFTDAGVIKMQE